MKINAEEIKGLIQEIDVILGKIHQASSENRVKLEQVHPSFRKGAENLLHYRALRTMNITSLQKRLGNNGLSRMASAESHVLSSLENCRFILKSLIGDNSDNKVTEGTSTKKAIKEQKSHAKDLFGYRSKGRRVRIMVTLPSEAAHQYDLVYDLIDSGMNTARINCAHDDPEEWKMMIENLTEAKKKLKRNCKISMDLGGPKIRTGAIESGPQIRKFRPTRNEFGQVVKPAMVVLVSGVHHGSSDELPVDETWLQNLKEGDQINFTDSRSKERTLHIKALKENCVIAISQDTFYIETGTMLTVTDSGDQCAVGDLPALEQSLLLKQGDMLRIIKEQIPGKPAQYGKDGIIESDAFISCTSEEIFEDVKEGEKILFDDGKIVGVIKAVDETEIEVEILQAKASGSKLKADKGINLPESDLKVKGLTAKDREDLKFVVEHADVVNFSFVNSAADVNDLLTELERLGAKDKLGVILKIETQSAYNNLTDIMLEGMRNYPLGVMIARGDLAIESGWENMARIQQEILLLCNAAHVPDVWATQVLENLAKKGIPSRSEITDAAGALKADCVMLNKGPFILSAVNLLDYILSSMNQYQDKNEKMFPAMEEASTTNFDNKKSRSSKT
ncbi:MAG: pyruvate kinase [Cyclobacteriaceae bacterium]